MQKLSPTHQLYSRPWATPPLKLKVSAPFDKEDGLVCLDGGTSSVINCEIQWSTESTYTWEQTN